MGGLLEFLQGANDSAASNVYGPVEGLAWLLRKAGVPVPEGDRLVGGKDWMKGLLGQDAFPAQTTRSSAAGETLGLLSPIVAAAKAPQIAQGLLRAIENANAPTGLAGTAAGRQAGKVGGNLKPTVRNPQQSKFPGIYKDPRVLAAEANARVAPEGDAMKRLFGVNRDELYEQFGGRVGNEAPKVKMAPNPTGSQAASNVMTKANEARLVDALWESEKYPGLTRPMDTWYVMDPAYRRLEEIVGKDAAPAMYKQLNAMTGMMSPSSDVLTELNRGTAANWLHNEGRIEDFFRYGNKAGQKGAPKDMAGVMGHAYHSTAQGGPLRKYLEAGDIDMKSPKVPLYIQSSGVPETGFQTRLPVGDAHWSRAVGLADTRTNADFGKSVTTPELAALRDWWPEQIAAPAGLESVAAQARTWGLFSPQTGVDSPIGAPKLELLAEQIMKAAKRMGITPEQARDMILTGKAHAGAQAGAAVGLGGLLGAQMGEDEVY